MMGGGVVVEATTNSSIESLLPRKASYTCSICCADDELSFRSCLRWMYVDQSDTRHVVSLGPSFLFLLSLSPLPPILSSLAPPHTTPTIWWSNTLALGYTLPCHPPWRCPPPWMTLASILTSTIIPGKPPPPWSITLQRQRAGGRSCWAGPYSPPAPAHSPRLACRGIRSDGGR